MAPNYITKYIYIYDNWQQSTQHDFIVVIHDQDLSLTHQYLIVCYNLTIWISQWIITGSNFVYLQNIIFLTFSKRH